MRLFVLGGTGKTGGEVLDVALARGHDVTAFARSPGKITRAHPRQRLVQGDPHDAKALAAALPGHDAVLSALGPRPREAMTRTTLLRECATSTVSAMKEVCAQRLVIVSSALLFPVRAPLFVLSRFVIAPHVRDLRAMEQVVAESAVDWTIARPPRLVATRDERYEALDDGLPSGPAILSWRALAIFLVDAAEQGNHSRCVVGLRG